MNRKHIILAVATLVGLTLAACQQETPVIPTPGTTSGTEASTVSYTVDGKPWQVSYDDELEAIIIGLMPYVREGHTLVLGDSSDPAAVPTKGVVTFRTASDTAAAAWATEKYLQGYTVTVTFDAETQEYVCRAEIKTAAQHAIPTTLVGTEWMRHDTMVWFDGNFANANYYEYDCVFSFLTDSTATYFEHYYETESQPAYDITGSIIYTYQPETGLCKVKGLKPNTDELYFYFELLYDGELDALVQSVGPSAVYSRVN